ncbi:TPA: restriction endonuclease subunit S [Escherichia coli]|uniref:restriction endonuclease subunit S n=1 Tax=Escherichia coli TaxID=562 RepID=UPI003890F21E|nr:restriction endonuclease subunit S [Escherichia coli]HCB4628869.1 restriction endonuclease subunit S [Escherichia coli]
MTDKQTIKFGDICREVKLTTKDPIADGYERYIGLEHLDSGSLKIKRWGIISEDNPSFTRVFKKGHILFGKRRPYLKKAAVAEFNGICSGDIIVLEPISPDQFELLELVVQMKGFWEWAIQTSSGSLSPRTKFSAIKEYTIPLSLDELGKLGVFVKPINFTASKMNELSTAANELKKAFLEKELWGFYNSKNYVPLKSLCTKITDGTHQQVKRAPNGKIPFLYVSCIASGVVVWENTDRISLNTYSSISRGREIDENVILYTAVGSYGNAVHIGNVVDAAFQRHIAYIKIDPNKANPKFIEIWINSRFGKFHSDKLAIGNAQKTVTLGDLAKFPVPPLSMEEQNKIVNVFSQIDSVLSEIINGISSYSSIKSSLVDRC